jgi:hypothetical protein
MGASKRVQILNCRRHRSGALLGRAVLDQISRSFLGVVYHSGQPEFYCSSCKALRRDRIERFIRLGYLFPTNDGLPFGQSQTYRALPASSWPRGRLKRPERRHASSCSEQDDTPFWIRNRRDFSALYTVLVCGIQDMEVISAPTSRRAPHLTTQAGGGEVPFPRLRKIDFKARTRA